ncbi:mycothiol synthase [Leucobacter sp. NPDC077196]|uniref:mycothiol synthase n=1 Tax=Leucobacter sp. NPDC077196 TaxID=3154959 RepID=UPI003422E745
MMHLESNAATRSSDFELARHVIAVAEVHDGASPVSDQALLAATQGERTLLLFRREGEPDPVAIGVAGQGEVDLVVLPNARGEGIATSVLPALLERVDGAALAWAHGANPAAEALLTRAGFAPVRSLLRMTLDPALLPQHKIEPSALDTPPGFALRAFDPERTDDAERWVRANAAAFATHPEQGRLTESDFALMRAEEWFDPDDLLLLIDQAGEVAGSTWVKTLREPEVETELYAVGVRPEYAGRGLGALLLEATLARMAQHEPARVSLYVDGDNERAVRMYERAGFTVDSRSRQWRKAPAASPGATMDA